MADDSDDYMSEDILNQCVKNDIRPGLPKTKQLRRQHEMFKKKLATNICFDKKAEKIREIGLQSAIPESNIGFKMIQKMGYKPGSGIGKLGAGPSAPIDIKMKNNNFGLGLKSQVKEDITTTSLKNFRQRISKQKELRKINQEYAEARRSCYDLDSSRGVKKPTLAWFWPDNVVEDSESESDSDDEPSPKEIEDRLETIAQYVLKEYSYCTWCRVTFKNSSDMESFCPGPTRKDHMESGDGNSSAED